MSDVGWLFSVLMAGVAVCGIARMSIASRERGSMRGQVAHILMTLAMAVMFAPTAPKPSGPWVAAGLAVAGLLCLPSPRRNTTRRAPGRHLHTVSGCFAMAYMFALPSAGMPRMTGMAMTSGDVTPWFNAAVAAYFLVEAAWSGVRLATAGAGSGKFLVSGELGIACHVATGIAMSYMFLAMA
jgi:hypothetical protein